jgi:hypothetical protein
LPISDSLSGTTSTIELRSLRTANEVLEELDALDELLELERALDEEAAGDAVELAPVELPVLEALVVPLADTFSPT